MKVKIEMELEALLRIACLLDHHRTDCAANGEGERESPTRQRWVDQAGEARTLRETLLKSIRAE
jgi:hypothetical protein